MNSRKSRADVLAEASDAVLKDRNADYGDPEDNFRDIAILWTAWMAATDRPVTITALDVAQMMIHVKQARMKTSPYKRDHHSDIAGYAACGYACAAQQEQDENQQALFGEVPPVLPDIPQQGSVRIHPSDEDTVRGDRFTQATRKEYPRWSNRW